MYGLFPRWTCETNPMNLSGYRSADSKERNEGDLWWLDGKRAGERGIMAKGRTTT